MGSTSWTRIILLTACIALHHQVASRSLLAPQPDAAEIILQAPAMSEASSASSVNESASAESMSASAESLGIPSLLLATEPSDPVPADAYIYYPTSDTIDGLHVTGLFRDAYFGKKKTWLKIAPGSYKLTSRFEFWQFTDCVFDVRGVTFSAVVGTSASTDSMWYCASAKNFRTLGGKWMNLSPLAYSQAKVTAVSGATITVKPMPGYNAAVWATPFGYWYWYASRSSIIDGQTLAVKTGAKYTLSDGAPKAGSVAGTFVYKTWANVVGVSVGDILTRGAGPDGPTTLGHQSAGIKAENCKNIMFDGMTTNTLSFSAWGGASDTQLRMKNSRFINGPNPAGGAAQAYGFAQKGEFTRTVTTQAGGTMYQKTGSSNSLTMMT